MTLQKLQPCGAVLREIDLTQPIDEATSAKVLTAFNEHVLLHSRVISPEGGQTEFADMRTAWDALPEAKRAPLEGLIAGRWLEHLPGTVGYENNETEQNAMPPVQQGLVRRHPVSGGKSLFLGSHASCVIGWLIDRGEALLRELTELATPAPGRAVSLALPQRMFLMSVYV